MLARTASLLLAAAPLLAACGMGAPAARSAASAPPAERLAAAIEAQGCVLTSANVEPVLLQANLRQADLPGLTASLASQGRIEATDGTAIRLLSQNCI